MQANLKQTKRQERIAQELKNNLKKRKLFQKKNQKKIKR
jgi:hypothetical protein